METEIFLEKLLQDGMRISIVNDSELRIQPGRTPLTDTEKTLLKDSKRAVIGIIGDGRIARMSYQQERLWFLDQAGMGEQYMVPGVVTISGDIDTDILEQSLNYLIDRHEILRTNFIKINHLPCQKVNRYARVNLDRIDLTMYTGEKLIIAKELAITEFFNYRFSLTDGPLIKVLWIKLDTAHSVLAVAMHHIITDGWSMQVVLKELSVSYSAFLQQQAPELAPLQLQYLDYAAWQREARQQQANAPSLEFWKEKLSGYQELEMPTDFPRKAALSGRGNFLRFDLSREHMQSARDLAKDSQVSPFSIFAAAVYHLLYTLSGQSDICLGMPVANREHPEIEKLIGFFVNTVVLRFKETEIDALSAMELIESVYRSIIDAQEHQSVPIEKVLEYLQPARDPARTPVFQILISYNATETGAYALGESSLCPSFDLKTEHAKFDLTFTFNESFSGPSSLYIEYSTDLFCENTIKVIGRELVQWMELVVKIPQAKLTKLQGLSAQKNWHYQHELNRNAMVYPVDRTIHQLFEQQTLSNPQTPALHYKTETITYKELNGKSTLLAAYLQSLEPEQDRAIAICMEQSPKLISGILGILKAGAAYLPIDTSYPQAFIKFMLEDSGAGLLLCDGTTYAQMAYYNTLAQVTVINVDAIVYPAQACDTTLMIKTQYSAAAYLMYTSGTSGTPKGVLVGHASVINHNYSVQDIYALGENIPVLQFSSPAFDIFVEEVFATLLSGGTLVLPDNELRTDSGYLKQLIKKHSIAIANFPTAYWNAIATIDFSSTSLRTVIIGGEKAEATLLRRWYAVNPDIQVINTYGPTETTVIALYHATSPNDNFSHDIPLGRPIANTQVYLLDAMNNPVAKGMPGELCIAGDGLAEGYWNNEALTRQKFIEHPALQGKRIYKTGDRARWNAEGQVEFLGRMDNQAKIRGFRVEPQHIEKVLLSHQDITEASVIIDRCGHVNSLVAFIVQSNTTTNEPEYYTAFLQETLPPYMIPSKVILIDSIPLKTTGKVDRERLALLDFKTDKQAPHREPNSNWEIRIAGIWKKVLNLQVIGSDEDFFSLGGHSLMTVELVSRLNEKYQLSLTVVDVLRYPTIAAMALQAERNSAIAPDDLDIVLLKKGRPNTVPVFIIPGMPGLSDGYYEMAQQIEGATVYGLQMKGFRDGLVLETIEAMASHNIALISKVCPAGPIRLIAHSYGGTVLYQMLHLMQDSQWRMEQILLIDSSRFRDTRGNSHEALLLFFKSLFKSFAIANSQLLAKIEHIVKANPKEYWQRELDVAISESETKRTNPFFLAVWKVIAASLSVQYKYPHGKLPYTIQLIIASASSYWLGEHEWDSCYTSVKSRVVEGDHMTIVQAPGCSAWTDILNT